MYINEDNTKALKKISDKTTEFKKLNKLLKKHHGDIAVAEAIAKHPNCSKELLGNMLYYQLDAAKQNPLYSEYSKDDTWMRKHSIHEKTDLAARYKSIGIYLNFEPDERGIDREQPQVFKLRSTFLHVSHKVALKILDEIENIPEEYIIELATHENSKLRVLAATIYEIPDHIALVLAGDKLKSVRLSLAENDSASAESITILTQDTIEAIVKAALKNSNCPKKIIKEIRTKKKARKTLPKKSITELPFNEKIELLIDKNTNSSVLEKFIDDNEPLIRHLVGYHPNCTDSIFKTLFLIYFSSLYKNTCLYSAIY